MRLLSGPNKRIFIGLIGQERVAYAQFKWEDDTNRFGISYGVAENHRGCGYGAEVSNKAMDQMTAATGGRGRGYEAWIAEDNIASQKAAKNAGFSQRPEVREDTFLYPYCVQNDDAALGEGVRALREIALSRSSPVGPVITAARR
jgi:RimJ/RimL family protein N-acetyltransferase